MPLAPVWRRPRPSPSWKSPTTGSCGATRANLSSIRPSTRFSNPRPGAGRAAGAGRRQAGRAGHRAGAADHVPGPWQDDNGEIHVNRGFRVEFNGALGPYKGGLRFHPTVNLGIVKFLGFEQIFKNALTGLGIGGGKGGSDFDPHGRSDEEVMRFCQSFMTELYRHVGEHTDVPVGDIGVGTREVGYLFGQYRRVTNRWEAGMLTGKGALWGGSMRPDGGDRLRQRHVHLRDAPPPRRGPGRPADRRVRLRQRRDLHDREGAAARRQRDHRVGLQRLRGGREGHRPRPDQDDQGGRAGPRVRLRGEARRVRPVRPRGRVWDVPADIALPSATQNELDAEAARVLVRNGVKAVSEGANMPTTPDAVHIFQDAGVAFGPGKAANAGGVAVSALEMRQNASRACWSFSRVEEELAAIMTNIHETCYETAERYGAPGDYVVGANIVASNASPTPCSPRPHLTNPRERAPSTARAPPPRPSPPRTPASPRTRFLRASLTSRTEASSPPRTSRPGDFLVIQGTDGEWRPMRQEVAAGLCSGRSYVRR